MSRRSIHVTLSVLTVVSLSALAACQEKRDARPAEPPAVTNATTPASTTAAQANPSAEVERGAYLVTAGGCGDCHTPLMMTKTGPAPDMSRALSGHPASMTLPPPPAPVGPWIVSATATNTAWAGPWGVSFTANLTPDPETGLGKWTRQMFIDAIKTGRHMGSGRPILPPMPVPAFTNYSEADLGAMFAYLKTVKPIVNAVPAPLPPREAPPTAK